jgi:hypothetical protein
MKLHSLFDLTIEEDRAPLLPDPQDASVQIWRDYHGKECAYAYKENKHYWLHFPSVATYRISKNTSEVLGFPEAHSNHHKIQDLFSRIVLPIALHTRGMQVLHASAIRTPDGVAAFCAMSDTGKSTTAFALTQRGYEQWADDAVPFEITGKKVHALPLKFERRIDSRATEHLGPAGKLMKHHEDSNAVPLAIVFVLHRMNKKSKKEIEIQQLSAPQAFRSVLLHAHFFNLSSTDLKKHMVADYMKLTSLLPVIEIHFQPGFERLPTLLDEIEKTIKKSTSLKVP